MLPGSAEKVRARGAWRIGKADVEAALRQAPVLRDHPSPIPSPQGGRGGAYADRPADGQRVAFNNIRRQTAERLAEAWRTIPHVTQAVEVDFSAVERVRQARKVELQVAARRVADIPALHRARRCIAIADYPRVNARLDGDGLVLSPDLNLGIAVDLSHEGLVVPVLKHADELTAGGLAKAIGRLVEKARSKALTPDDFCRRHLHDLQQRQLSARCSRRRSSIRRRWRSFPPTRSARRRSSSRARQAIQSPSARSACLRRVSIIAPSTAPIPRRFSRG